MYNLREFRNYVGLKQTELAELFGCTQPNIVRFEKLFSDLPKEYRDKLISLYGEETVMKFTITDDSFQKPKRKQTQQDFEQSSRLDDLVSEQQKSIQDLIDMVKKLQAENSKLTDALLRQKII